MIKLTGMLLICFMILSTKSNGQSILDKIKQKAKERTERKTDSAIDKSLDEIENSATPKGKVKVNEKQQETPDQNVPSIPQGVNITAYQNYDFVPGDNILFEDNFVDDQDGEFPAHWTLEAGQGVVNKVKGEKAFFMTDGNYGRFNPRMKKADYLSDPFTIEFDMYYVPGSYGVHLILKLLDKTVWI